nr:MAG TPA: hypothetical protein [Caudoviricetes sp.]
MSASCPTPCPTAQAIDTTIFSLSLGQVGQENNNKEYSVK